MGWVENSAFIPGFPLNQVYILYIAIAVGGTVLVHSFYLHKLQWKLVRITNDVAAAALVFQSVCFLNCSVNMCSLKSQAIVNNFFANAIFGGCIQVCDNLMTFSRYSIVSGQVSPRHRILAFLWVFLTLYLTWWEFYTILPFFFDMNSENWYQATVGLSYVVNSSYIVYDCFYLVLLVRFLLRAESGALTSSRNENIYRIFAAKAVGHTLLSMAGVCTYTFNFPMGILEQNIIVILGIHIFLNWTGSHRLFCWKKNKPIAIRVKPTSTPGRSSHISSFRRTISGGWKKPSTRIVVSAQSGRSIQAASMN